VLDLLTGLFDTTFNGVEVFWLCFVGAMALLSGYARRRHEAEHSRRRGA
jgi:hypothetical protein